LQIFNEHNDNISSIDENISLTRQLSV